MLFPASYGLLPCDKKLIIVPGATHLFEEPGTLEQVAEHACTWFQIHVVIGWATRKQQLERTLRVITVYIPRPPKWTDLRTRGTKP
jgi:hypothetical protein